MNKIRVLLADDHPVVRVGLRALLANEPDMEVVGEASTGLQAVTLAQELDPDVVIMDISMPGNGLDATRQIKTTCLKTQVLILTVHAEERYILHVLKVGGAGYVLKSTIHTELVDAIRTVAQGGAFLYPSGVKLFAKHYLAKLAAGEGQDVYDQLSDREREVLKLTALGYSACETAKVLALSPKSVETYRARLMQKLNLNSRPALVQYAMFHGLLTEDIQ
jgi:two-component system response regulator NreC